MIQTRQVKINEPFTVILKGNLSTGYVWKYMEVSGLKNISIQQTVDNLELIGGFTTVTLYFQAEVPGEFPLRIVKMRPWEKQAEPLASYEEVIYAS